MSAKPKCPKCKQRQLNEIGIASKLNAEERDKWKARAEAAEAERDTANAKLRVMESRMKQVHAALLASMSDEQLAQSVKAR